jgi:hypothetical protein
MTHFLMDTIAMPLAALAALFGSSARQASPRAPACLPASAAPTRPAEEAAPSASPAASTIYPDYGAETNCGWMTGAIAAFRSF